eukprot:GEMP01014506.1.p1 GENE.GEMP01014506.1~~GEMP01014506.1.p1  ORF type:complete len:749 (+),score=132.86 GEMP01014506.1:261-2507(+)
MARTKANGARNPHANDIQLAELGHRAGTHRNPEDDNGLKSEWQSGGRESCSSTTHPSYYISGPTNRSFRYQTEVLISEEEVSLMVMTWNCGGRQPDRVDIMKSVLQKHLVDNTGILVFGLQEVCELNFNSFIRSSARKQMYKKWEKFLTEAVTHFGDYCVVSQNVELMGLQMVVFATPSLVPSLSFRAAAYVMCGGGGFVGNKGGVGWRMNINQTSIAFCCVHLAAGHGSKAAEMRVLDARNVENMEFEYRMRRWSLSDHDVVIFLGDTNSRLMVNQVEAQEIMDELNTSLHHSDVDQIVRDWLPHDEFLLLKTEGAILQHFHEAPIRFPPTYKHVVGSDGFDAAGMTASGKIRVPGWTDRVFYKCPNNRSRGCNFVVDSYAWEPQLKLSDHRPVVLTARFSTVRIARPLILRYALVPLLTESPTRTYMYPFRAIGVIFGWRLSTNVLLGYAFVTCWVVSVCLVVVLSCSFDRDGQCAFTQFYDFFCTNFFSFVEPAGDAICMRQILFFRGAMFFESILIYGFISQICLAVVKESLFNRTIHALGSEVIATHVDSVLKEMQAKSWCASACFFLRRASIEFAFGLLHLVWCNAWLLLFSWLSIQITIAMGGPPHCRKELQGYKTLGFYDPARCYIKHWDEAPAIVRSDWAWRQSFTALSFIPWIFLNGVYCGFLPIIQMSSFFQDSLSIRGILCTFWRVKWGFFPFGLAAALVSSVPIVNLVAPMSNAVAVALWVIDVERMLQAPRMLI